VFPTPNALRGAPSHNAAEPEARAAVVRFMQAMATRFGERVHLAQPGLGRQDFVLLPSVFSQRVLHRVYAEWLRTSPAAPRRAQRTVGVSTLQTWWRSMPELAHIRVHRRTTGKRRRATPEPSQRVRSRAQKSDGL
jgi:hypothetical protein